MGYLAHNLTETLAEEIFKIKKEQKGKEEAHKTTLKKQREAKNQ